LPLIIVAMSFLTLIFAFFTLMPPRFRLMPSTMPSFGRDIERYF
jgi:hypothetical protein